jgi:hypothetical protein
VCLTTAQHTDREVGPQIGSALHLAIHIIPIACSAPVCLANHGTVQQQMLISTSRALTA